MLDQIDGPGQRVWAGQIESRTEKYGHWTIVDANGKEVKAQGA